LETKCLNILWPPLFSRGRFPAGESLKLGEIHSGRNREPGLGFRELGREGEGRS